MKRNVFLPVAAVAISLLAAQVRADTLYFQSGGNNFWTNAANWYVQNVQSQLVPTNRLPFATDTAVVIAKADATATLIQLNTLILQPFAEVTNAAFLVQTFQMTANSILNGSTITVDSEMDVLSLGNSLRNSTLIIIGGAFALMETNGARLTLSEGSLISNQGEFILKDTSALFSANTGPTTNIFDNRPGAKLRSSGTTFVSASIPGFVITNTGVVRADTGTLTLQGMKWTTTSGACKFETGVSNAAINFTDSVNVDAGITFLFTGPGVSHLNGAAVQGTIQIGAVDPQTQIFSPGNVAEAPFPAQILGAGLIHVLGTNGLGSTLAITNAPITQTAITIDPTAQLVLISGELIVSNVINNSGLIVLTGPPSAGITFSGGATINNSIGGTFDDRTDGPIAGITGVFNNAGTFRKSSGTGVSSLGSQNGNPFNNIGLLDIQSGSVNLFMGTNTGQFNTTTGSTLAFAGDVDILNSGTSFSGGGLIQVSGPHPILIVNGNVTLPNLDLETSATIDGPGQLIVNGPFLWNGGTLQGGGTLDLTAAAVTTLSGAPTRTLDQRTINNSGAFNWTGTATIAANNGAVFNNFASAIFDIKNDASFTFGNVGARPAFNNAGIFRKFAGSGTTFIAANFTNSGSVLVNTQTINFQAAYQQVSGSTIVSSNTTLIGSLLNIQGGTLGGSGMINAGVTNSGTVSPGMSPGVLTIGSGNGFTQSVAGILSIELGGLATGAQYDQLAVSGRVSLNGSLNISLVNGFTPNPGDRFTILTCASRTGTFPVKDGDYLGNGLALVPLYSSTNVVLVASNVTVLQPLIGFARAGNSFQLTWPAVLGQPYQVEYSANLFNWFVLSNFTAAGTTASMIDPTPIPGVPARFYRLR